MYWSTRALCRTALGVVARSWSFPSRARARNRPHRIASPGFLRAYAVTMRPYLLFVSGITGIVGLALAPSVPMFTTLLLATAFFLSYGFGQAFTDCFQLDTDALSAPYRPLVRGEIHRRDVITVSLIGLAAIGVVLALHHPLNIPLAVVAVLGLATYTPFKRRWWAGPFYNAWIVALLALIGYLSGVGAADLAPVWSPVLGLALTSVFFGYANFVLVGYYKDVSADRATGYRTLPVVFGLGSSAMVSDIFATLSIAGAVAVVTIAVTGGGPVVGHGFALAFLGFGLGTSLLAQLRLHRVTDEAQAHRAIAPVVDAYVFMGAAMATSLRPDWWPSLAVFFIAYRIAMNRRPMRQQI